MGVRRGVQRATLLEASQLLGISKGAVRQRVRRGTLRSEKGEDGKVYVYVDPSTDDVHTTDTHTEAGERYVGSLEDQVEYLRTQLDQEREARTEERRRQDTIIAQLSQANVEQARTIRELEPAPDASNPADYLEHEETLREDAGMETRTDEQRQRWHEHRHGAPRESPESAGPTRTPTDAGEGPQTGTRRPWWRRMFGG